MLSTYIPNTTGVRTWLRFSAELAVVTVFAVLFSGCSGRECDLAECRGDVELHLVGEDGQQVAARFRHRSNQFSGTVYYDCGGENIASPLPESPRGTCQDGVALLDQPYFDRPELKYEIGFLLPDGEWTDWQAIPLTSEEVTVEDFNGAGCDCTFKQGKTPPLEVPIEAQIRTE